MCPSRPRRHCGCRAPACRDRRSDRSSRRHRHRCRPACVGSTLASPSVTISFFSRTFSRAERHRCGGREFQLKIVEPAAEQLALLQGIDQARQCRPSLPASVPLMPSGASSTLPFSSRASAKLAQRLPQARGSQAVRQIDRRRRHCKPWAVVYQGPRREKPRKSPVVRRDDTLVMRPCHCLGLPEYVI